jgi:hypothetical protein
MGEPPLPRIPEPIRQAWSDVDPAVEPTRPAYTGALVGSTRASPRRGERMHAAGEGNTKLLGTRGTPDRMGDARVAAHAVALRALRALGGAGRSS